MKNKIYTYIILVLVLLITGSLAFWWLSAKKEKHLMYVNNVHLFNEFLLKKELEKDLNKAEMLSKSQLDSLRLEVELLSRKIEGEKSGKEIKDRFEVVREQYFSKEEQIKLRNEQVAKQYNEQIWNQLNAYVKQFAKDNEYDMLLGTSGDGNVMYADEKYDVTESAIAYVNQKYKGK
jgi:outer membrane protein